ncbi:MAG: M23 family metallopeptidase [Clostridia bacterium]|nr:M23 family metallopeptidase [Clostridia bacterium]
MNRNTDLLALDEITVSIYDSNNTLLESESSSLLYANEDSLVKLFHAILTNKSPLRFSPLSSTSDLIPITATITSDKISETLTCYFLASNSDSYCTDSSGSWYKIERTDAYNFLISSYSETLYEHSIPPLLSTADGDIILPNSVKWHYKNYKNEFVPASKNKISSQINSYNITDSLGLQFTTTPDYCTVTVYNQNSKKIFEGPLNDISNITVNSDEILTLNVYAEWKKAKQELYFGSTTYNFKVEIRNHSEFYISDNSVSPKEFIVLSCTNISNTDDLEFSTDLRGFSPNFAYDGEVLKCLIPYPTNHLSDKFNLSVKYGASSETFTISIDKNESSDSNEYDKEFDKKISNILKTAPAPLNIKNCYIKDDFLLPTLQGFNQRDILINSELISATEFIAKESAQKVTAATSGKIVAIEKYDLIGNTVIIDHGLGIQTWYFGISDISVSLGDYILQGETLGRSGICELSSSDGFIFMVSVNGSIIDPQLFFDFPNHRS